VTAESRCSLAGRVVYLCHVLAWERVAETAGLKRKDSMNKVSKSISPVKGHDHVQGSINAPYVLVEYGDYQCPYCGEAHEVVKEIQERLGDKLCFVYRNFPLVDIHEHAEHAAEAAEAAAAQGRFWEMHNLLFENQNALEDEDLAAYAAELGLDAKRLIADVRSGAHAARIKQDLISGEQNGVNGTPAFFVNGTPYEDEPTAENLIAALIERAE
jgi:protein-disulfide isomerase